MKKSLTAFVALVLALSALLLGCPPPLVPGPGHHGPHRPHVPHPPHP